MRMQANHVLDELLDHGSVTLSDAALGNERVVAETLIAFESEYRRSLAYEPPALVMAAAVWAATIVHESMRAVIYRERSEAEVVEALSVPCPEDLSAGAIYAVDLTLRFLPDVFRLARAASEEDPLHEPLRRLASDWPLSSVGIAGVELSASGQTVVEALLADDCLRMLYVDRIIEQGDVSRIDNERVRTAVKSALGTTSLAPPILQVGIETEPRSTDAVSSSETTDRSERH